MVGFFNTPELAGIAYDDLASAFKIGDREVVKVKRILAWPT